MMEKRENDEMDGSWWKLEAQKIQDNSGSCFYKVLAVALWVAGALFLLSSITFKQHAIVTGLLTVATGIYVWKFHYRRYIREKYNFYYRRYITENIFNVYCCRYMYQNWEDDENEKLQKN